MFRLRPPLPKYQSTFDIVPVLVHFLNQPTESLNPKQLSFKTLFLTIYSSLSRVSSISRLGPTFTVHQESAILEFTSLEKQGRVGNTRGYLQIPTFPPDPELCPVRALVAYRDKVGFFLYFYSFLFACLFRWQLYVETVLVYLCPTAPLTRVSQLRLLPGG